MEQRFSKTLYGVDHHLRFAEKLVRNLAALADRSHVVPYKPEPGLLSEGQPEPEFVIVNRQQMDALIEKLRSEIAVGRKVLLDHAAAHGETAEYWGEGNTKDEDNR